MLNYVLHHNQGLISSAKRYMRPRGNIIVFDHDKQGLSFSEFEKLLTDADEKEIIDRDFWTVYTEHTGMQPQDCKNLGWKNNLMTIDLKTRTDLEVPFYVWVGTHTS